MKFKIFILCLLVFGLCQFRLFPEISCRIQGEVLDKDTGLPIKGAWVNLFGCSNPIFKDFCSSWAEQRTDSRGEFKFEELRAGQFFLVVVHRAYRVYGPIYEVREYLGANTRGELEEEIPRGRSPHYLKSKPERNFYLEEGQIKHFVIQLERAAELEITAKIKLPSGTNVYKDEVVVFIDDATSGEPLYGLSFRDGFFKSRCLPALGSFMLKYKTRGYALTPKTVINLKKGQLEKVEIIFDFTSGQIIHGFIKSKQLNCGLPGIQMTLYERKIGGCMIDTSTGRNGEFWFGGMKPGEYKLFIHSPSGLIKEILTIKQNEKIELNKEF